MIHSTKMRGFDARHQPLGPSAFTLVELLVSLSIIGLLLSITLPAVQQARGTAQKVTCKNNLRQIGLGTHQYLDTHGFFPQNGQGSILTKHLPYVGYQNLWNVYLTDAPECTLWMQVYPIAVFVCPCDPVDMSGGMSYLTNRGTVRYIEISSRIVHPKIGFLSDWYGAPLRPRDFLDGLSNTAEMAEVKLQTMIYTTRGLYPGWDDAPLMATECRDLPDSPAVRQELGNVRWIMGANYDHCQTPNSRMCYPGARGDGGPMIPSTSHHLGGSHLLLADGSVRFVANAIHTDTWKALGTRSNHEVGSEF